MTTSSLLRLTVALTLASVLTPAAPVAQDGPHQRSFTVVARKYAFEPVRLEANLDDLVRVTLSSRDIAHSFTIDAYRIAKRVGGGQTVSFEFRADQAGTFPVYCNLRQDERCREMHAELVVHPR
jgi:heme/copper-type cytochrome/quinol oxidase subunit 2